MSNMEGITIDYSDQGLRFVQSAQNKSNENDSTRPVESTSKRSEFLQEVASLVDGDRNVQYGDPNADFSRTATLWSAYLGFEIKAHEVAAMMILLKVSRLSWNPTKRDTWLDIAGYAACGNDVVESWNNAQAEIGPE